MYRRLVGRLKYTFYTVKKTFIKPIAGASAHWHSGGRSGWREVNAYVGAA